MKSGLENLTLLLVEDNAFILDLLERILRNLGFERIHKARDGEAAIRFLRQVKHHPNAAGTGAVDLVISDLVMSPINGLLLLQWIRSNADSPNRFLPFVMLSGAADSEYVEAARHLGVSEFLAKPFSVSSVHEHLRELIERPRPFILTKNYFGPDRRRQQLSPPADVGERRDARRIPKAVYSEDKLDQPIGEAEVWVFQLPNTLKTKLGRGSQHTFELPTELLKRAETDLERVVLDFHDWAADYLRRLTAHVTNAEQDPEPQRRRRILSEVNDIAHELRGQGGLFGYPLMTTLALSLFEATQAGCALDDDAIAIVKAHVDAMRVVVRDQVKEDGGPVGRALLESLRQAIAHHARDPNAPRQAPPRRAR
jgi:CheY-like chemotaxis protein